MPTVSHSWKASLPIRCVGTWPVMQTSGMESIMASVSGVTMLVAPGPEVTSATPGLAGGAGIALGRVAGALLVADEDVLDLLLLEDLVVDREHGAAGIAENVLHALVGQRPQDHLRAGHLLWHRALRPGLRTPANFETIKKGPDGTPERAPPFAAAYTAAPAVRNATISSSFVIMASF